ncbi:MAG: nucleoside triphosphate diphosphatase [Gaiellales bacterium]|nr:nucleoside triphosphate diphosphatase [Gaiellales bacterium]
MLIVALGPGDLDLLPIASLEALHRAGAVQLDDGAAGLASALERRGVELVAQSETVAALDARALELVRAGAASSVPSLARLEQRAAAQAATELLELTATLRRECPWDRVQTVESIVPHTLEEAYEVAESAREAGPSSKLIDELGDLLFQTTFLALLCSEAGQGDWADVAAGVTRKLIRRHPHVFGDAEAETAGEVRVRWEQVKVDQEARVGIFHDVPELLPGLLYARKLQRRAASVGFEYDGTAAAFADLESEVRELADELALRPPHEAERPADRSLEAELGDVLFAVVNVARRLGADPELAVRAAARRFRERVERAEALAAADGVPFAGLETPEQERYYQRAKALLRTDDGATGAA